MKRLSILSMFMVFAWLSVLSAVVFFVGRFTVKGSSMSPTLKDGQVIWVNKLIMGARICMTDSADSTDMRLSRLPGFRSIRVGDIAVFNYIYGWKEGRIGLKQDYVYTKRCIACPGDSISIRDGYYVNSRTGRNTGIPDFAQGSLSSATDSMHTSLGINIGAYSPSRRLGWTIKEFGPLYVPAKGDTLRLNRRDSEIYYRSIEYETGIRPVIKGDRLILGDEEIDMYVFRHDWYFFAGDNVLDSKDSRYIGLVPDDFIIGIVITSNSSS